MIYNALNYIVQELNYYLMNHFSIQDNKAILGTIVNEAGEVLTENQNKIIISLVNLDYETNQQYAIANRYVGDKSITQNLPYNFNLDILTTALFSNYDEALKFLSQTIYFFQAKQVFNHENSPGLDPNIQKLTIEIVKINYHEMHNLWTALGTKYMPSVLFKIRMLSFQSGEIKGINTAIQDIDENINPNKP